jgi:hypothetical protein
MFSMMASLTGCVDIQIDGRKCAVFVARDITDRKRAEALESQNIYLQEEIGSRLRMDADSYQDHIQTARNELTVLYVPNAGSSGIADTV